MFNTGGLLSINETLRVRKNSGVLVQGFRSGSYEEVREEWYLGVYID